MSIFWRDWDEIVHSEYYFTSARIGFDIFRFEDGKIVEHWDNLQAKQPLNPSDHSMIDGETERSRQNSRE